MDDEAAMRVFKPERRRSVRDNQVVEATRRPSRLK
jgi:hypothetical protein